MPVAKNDYTDYVRPALGRYLESFGLSQAYHYGSGTRLRYYDEAGSPVEVIDFLGGYGAGMLGHNHPRITAHVNAFFDQKRVVLAQASERTEAARLARRLDEMFFNLTQKHCISVFGNSGAEAVEVAMKHAVLEYRLRAGKMNDHLSIPEFSYVTDESIALLEQNGIEPGPDLTGKLEKHNSAILEALPYFFSLKGAYHGKTNAALSLTYNQRYRESVEHIPGNVVFVSNEDETDIERQIMLLSKELIVPGLTKDGGLRLQQKTWVPVAALFIEPIQGEGGVVVMSPGFTAMAKQVCSKYSIPLVADEIQCGMWRTGTFTYSQQLGLKPDYLLLSKSLGGGVAKISATLISKDHYLPSFSLQHTSTFAEDDFSCSVALAAIEEIETSKVQMAIAANSSYLKKSLLQLQHRFSDIIEEIRGVGLMIGIAFRQKEYHANTLRFLIHEHWFGYALAGYLLNRHQIRVAPTLSHDRVIRIQPSCLVTGEEIDKLAGAMAELCLLLRANDSGNLLGHLVGRRATNSKVPEAPGLSGSVSAHIPNSVRVAFIGHFIQASDMAKWDPALECLSETEADELLDRVLPIAAPVVYNEIPVKSVQGQSVVFTFIGLPVTSATIAGAIRRRELDSIRSLVSKAVDLAIEKGCSVAGLGGYTSIVSKNGKDFSGKPIGITTGNAFTVAAGMDAIVHAAEQKGILLPESSVAVIGAAGNIGSVFAEILAARVSRLTLVGRPGSLENLKRLAGGLMLRFHTRSDAREPSEVQAIPDPALYYESMLLKYGSELPVQVADGLGCLKSCNVIVSATNSSQPVIFPDMLGKNPTIIADLSVPADVDASVNLIRTDVSIIKGGLINLPLNPDFYVPGIPLHQGEVYACMAETILLGLENHTGHFSMGPITPGQVEKIREFGVKHGLTLARLKTEFSY